MSRVVINDFCDYFDHIFVLSIFFYSLPTNRQDISHIFKTMHLYISSLQLDSDIDCEYLLILLSVLPTNVVIQAVSIYG
jgi:hypothetical protein